MVLRHCSMARIFFAVVSFRCGSHHHRQYCVVTKKRDDLRPKPLACRHTLRYRTARCRCRPLCSWPPCSHTIYISITPSVFWSRLVKAPPSQSLLLLPLTHTFDVTPPRTVTTRPSRGAPHVFCIAPGIRQMAHPRTAAHPMVIFSEGKQCITGVCLLPCRSVCFYSQDLAQHVVRKSTALLGDEQHSQQ